jgi:hypothetical protein
MARFIEQPPERIDTVNTSKTTGTPRHRASSGHTIT